MDSEQQKNNEDLLIKAVADNSLEDLDQVLSNGNVNINCVDKHGMSPLQHACYKGNLPIAKFLLDRGADVNQNDHEHRYTALMFAALGGHVSLLNFLMDRGANIGATNSVGRTASQMAGFVGQHRSVTVINNYIAREQIEYYCKITGVESEPRLAVRFVQPLHSYVSLVSINPVRIINFLKSCSSLLEQPNMINNVLELLCEKLLRSKEAKEMLSFKMHYLNFIYKIAIKALESSNIKVTDSDSSEDYFLTTEKVTSPLNSIIKVWLKADPSVFPEKLLRESIRTYPFKENQLFQQLVHTLAAVEIGDEPSAQSLLTQAILGKTLEDAVTCFTCGEIDANKRCSKCKMVCYCDQTCQKLHWHVHKLQCVQLAEQRLQEIAETKLQEEISTVNESSGAAADTDSDSKS